MSEDSKPHSELLAWCDAIDASLAKIGEGDWTPQDTMLGRTGSMMRGLVEQLEAAQERINLLEGVVLLDGWKETAPGLWERQKADVSDPASEPDA